MHILCGAVTPNKVCAVVAEIIIVQALNVFAVGFRIAFNYSLIAFVSYILVNAVTGG